MRSRIFNLDWSQFNWKDREQRRMLAGALQYFCAMPNQFVPPRFTKVQEFMKAHKEFHAQLQAFTLPSDFPDKPSQIVRDYHKLTDFDNGYEQIFDIMDFTGTSESGYDVMDVESGLTFRSITPGEKVKVYQMSGDKYRCYFNYYGAALGWFRGLFEDKQYWTVEKNAVEFRNKAYSYRAQVFYTLLAAAAGLKGCCSVVPSGCEGACDADARSIAKSLNYAAATILTNCKNKGYGLNPATTQFVVVAPLNLRGRIRYALGQTMQAFAGSERLIDYNFKQITTLMGGFGDSALVVLPKYKLMGGYRMDLTLFDDFDILSYTDTVAGWMRYGGCIGDLDQIECIEFPIESGSCPTSPDHKIGKVIEETCTPESSEIGPEFGHL